MEELERKSAQDVKQAERYPILVILDDVRSMQNVGSVFRTGDAFNIAGIYLCGYTPQPPHRDIHKTALGATETVPWKHFSRIQEALDAAEEAGYTIYAVEQTHNSTPLHELVEKNTTPVALVFGNEVNGVGEEALGRSKGSIEIPQWGSKHSLNISVCAGIVLWEMVKSTIRHENKQRDQR